MKALVLSVICCALVAGAATAQIDTQTDGVGIYADLSGMTTRVHQEVGQPLEVYLLLTNPSVDVLLGWECGILAPDNARIWGFNTPIDGAAVLISGANFISGFPAPMPMQTVNLLMTFIITPLDDRCAYFDVGPNEGWGDPLGPRYLTSGDVILDMHPYTNEAGVSFAVNDTGQLPTVDATLDQVKALYR